MRDTERVQADAEPPENMKRVHTIILTNPVYDSAGCNQKRATAASSTALVVKAQQQGKIGSKTNNIESANTLVAKSYVDVFKGAAKPRGIQAHCRTGFVAGEGEGVRLSGKRGYVTAVEESGESNERQESAFAVSARRGQPTLSSVYFPVNFYSCSVATDA